MNRKALRDGEERVCELARLRTSAFGGGGGVANNCARGTVHNIRPAIRGGSESWSVGRMARSMRICINYTQVCVCVCVTSRSFTADFMIISRQ